MKSISAVTGCTPIGFAVAVASAAAGAALVNAYQPTRIWKYVMWEGLSRSRLTAARQMEQVLESGKKLATPSG
ncbi:MAG: hypothetical protein HY694_07065 [Deltaproteobacteria bacterium]|nr:hypothetical protein [Deltaproteobacteria bacterium]